MQKIVSFLVFAVLLCGAAAAQEDDAVWFELYEQIDYSELRSLVDAGNVESARIFNDGTWVTVKTKDGEFFDTLVTPQTPIADHLYEAGIPVKFQLADRDDETAEADEERKWKEIFLNILPVLVFIVVFVLILWWSHQRGKKVQDECLDRAKAMNDEFLDRQQKQFDAFIENLSSLLKNKNSNV